MDGQEADALARWREQLDGWAIPEEILAAAPESPWAYPVGLFRSRARRAGSRPTTPSNREAARYLPEGGSVLDVGAGAGAASLPLAGTAGRLVAVDESPEMLASFLAAAGQDRKSTRLNSSHTVISYAVFCLKKKRFCSGDFSMKYKITEGQ